MYYSGKPELQRKRQTARLSVLLVAVLLFIAFRAVYGPGASVDALDITDSYTVDIEEISALSHDFSKSELSSVNYFAVGDAIASVAAVSLPAQQKIVQDIKSFDELLVNNFSVCASFELSPCKEQKANLVSDWEGLATDKDRIFALQEHSAAVMVLDRNFTNVLVLNLDFSRYRKHQSINPIDRDVKLAEGLILLKDGRIIVAKESDPAALVEFSFVKNDKPKGISKETVLRPGEDFQLAPDYSRKRQQLYFVREWRFGSKLKCDMSDIAYDYFSDKLFILSQRCRMITEIALFSGNDKVLQDLNTWTIPREIKNPEGLLVEKDGVFLIGSDRKNLKKPNVFRVSAKKYLER